MKIIKKCLKIIKTVYSSPSFLDKYPLNKCLAKLMKKIN